jgi:hypothetical protein
MMLCCARRGCSSSACARVPAVLQSSLSHVAVFTLKFWSCVFLGVSWCLGLMCTSFVTYLLLYNSMIPQNHTAIPAHFDFSSTIVPPHATVHLQGEKQWRYTDVNAAEVTAEQSKRYDEMSATAMRVDVVSAR